MFGVLNVKEYKNVYIRNDILEANNNLFNCEKDKNKMTNFE